MTNNIDITKLLKDSLQNHSIIFTLGTQLPRYTQEAYSGGLLRNPVSITVDVESVDTQANLNQPFDVEGFLKDTAPLIGELLDKRLMANYLNQHVKPYVELEALPDVLCEADKHTSDKFGVIASRAGVARLRNLQMVDGQFTYSVDRNTKGRVQTFLAGFRTDYYLTDKLPDIFDNNVIILNATRELNYRISDIQIDGRQFDPRAKFSITLEVGRLRYSPANADGSSSPEVFSFAYKQ